MTTIDDGRNWDRRPGEAGSAQLRERLRAYADEVLSPDAAAAQRIRAAVMLEAGARLVARPLAITAAPVSPVRSARPMARRRFPAFSLRPFGLRPGMAFAAAAFALLIVGGTAFAASVPGGPLYGVRVLIEQASLPAGGQARVDAEAKLLQERMDEASAAAGQGNGPAVQAALDAYRTQLAKAIADAGGDLSHDAQLAQMLERHRAVLAALVAQLELSENPGQAADAIQRTLTRTEARIDEIDGKGSGQGAGNGQGNGQGNGSGQGNGQGNGSGQVTQPTPTPPAHPTPTPTPHRTPPVHPTPSVHPTPPEQPTPPPHPTPTPKDGSGGHGQAPTQNP